MADDQQEEQIQTPVSLEHSGTNNDMVQCVRELMYKDKSTVMVKVVDLLVLNLQQQQVIMVLKQTLQEASQQKEQMLKDLHDQPMMESLMSNIEAQNHSTRKQLGDKAESINMHMKSNEVLRKQLKKEIIYFRTGIDEAKRQIHEKEETGKFLHQALVEIVARIEEVGKQLRFVAGERAKLREENREQMDKMQRMKSTYAEIVEKLQTELTGCETALKQHAEELARVKQQGIEKVQACREMLSKKHDMQNISDSLNQQLQDEKAKLEETFAAEKKQINQMYEEKADAYKGKIEELNQTVESLTNIKKQREECIAELDVATSKMNEEINKVNNQNLKLENELGKFRSTVDLNSDSEEGTLNGPTLNMFVGKPREHIVNHTSPHAPPSSTDNEVSCHLDNADSSMSLDYNHLN
uniref:Uncharacterized protein n=1 Tax=Anopheles funestus TaxID=62324 RepID=A0A182RRR3_ANOFN